MKKIMSFILLCLLFISGCSNKQVTQQTPISKIDFTQYIKVCPKVGLGDASQYFEHILLDDPKNLMQKEETQDGFIRIFNATNSISYGKSDFYNSFGNPTRIGRIEENFDGLIGHLASNIFFDSWIKDYMPKDAKLIKSYRRDNDKKEIYVFKSDILCKIPGIEKAISYQNNPSSKGFFTLYVKYGSDTNTSNEVWSYILTLGQPNSTDLLDMKSTNDKHFRANKRSNK